MLRRETLPEKTCSSVTDKPQRVKDSRQHIRHITLQACSQAHNIKNNKQPNGCLGHFVFYIGLKRNHNSSTANITSYKRLFPYKKLWPLSSTPWLELLWFVLGIIVSFEDLESGII